MEQENNDERLLNTDLSPSFLQQSLTTEILRLPKQPKFNHRRMLFFLLAGIIFLTVLISIAIPLFSNRYLQANQTFSVPGDHLRQNCGTSPTEARQLGCKFDVMMNGWVPVACYNEALSEEYLSKNKFHFYTDAYAQNEVPMEIVRGGEWQGLYTGWEHHILHCAYMWKILVLAVEAGKGMFDSSSSSFAHTAHCSESMFEGGMIIAMMESSSVGNESFIQPGFLSCGQIIHSTVM